MLQIHLILDELDDGKQKVCIAQPAEHIFEHAQVFILHTAGNSVRKRSKYHQRYVIITFLDASSYVKSITVIRSRHTNHKVERGIFQLGINFFLGGYLREPRGIPETETHIFIEDFLINAAVVLQHEGIIRVSYKKHIKDTTGHQVGKRSIFEIKLV